MDLGAPARDVEELVAAFADIQGTELTQVKDLWRARNFSFIHEARPKDVIPSFYAQGLFSCALSHIVEEQGSLSWRLGGLYVLYTLHQTQPQESSSRIYLSLEELEALHALVKEIKKKRLAVAFKVVRKMFAEHMFLFGSVSANQKRIGATVDRLVAQAGNRVQMARSRLLTNVPIRQHFQNRLVEELGLSELTQLTKDYTEAKQTVPPGIFDGGVVDSGKVEPTTALELLKDAETWDSHKLRLLSAVQQDNISPISVHLELEDSQSQEKRKTIAQYERQLKQSKKKG